jgi:aminoglycoside 3-N-acetyltransferase I
MSSSAPFSIRLLTPADVVLMDAMLTTFGEVETYSGARPSRAYLARLLGSDCFIALAALKGSVVVGGIGAFERPARKRRLRVPRRLAVRPRLNPGANLIW